MVAGQRETEEQLNTKENVLREQGRLLGEIEGVSLGKIKIDRAMGLC